MKRSLRIILNSVAVIVIWTTLTICQVSQAQTETLEQRVVRGDGDAFIEAANHNRYDLIPALEKFSDDTTAQKALARLGVRQYVDLFVKQLTDTTNTDLYAYYRSREQLDPKTAEYMTKVNALRNLLFIHDKSTVRAIVSELDDTNRPPSHSQHIARQAPDESAVLTLERFGLENAPVVDKVKPAENDADRAVIEKWMREHPGEGPFATPEEKIAAWKKWWDQNKDKYP
ncbi:MAG: hypothetical protein ACLPT4_04405 [Verrucomicrobiia bacterium]